MEGRKEQEKPREGRKQDAREGDAKTISRMMPVTQEAYGGGLYGTEPRGSQVQPRRPPASDTQAADGSPLASGEPKHPPPPSSGDRDIDITGQSYIQ